MDCPAALFPYASSAAEGFETVDGGGRSVSGSEDRVAQV